MAGSHLAQFNIARALKPLDDPLLADFMNALDTVNALAERTPGFVWRLQDDSGNATDFSVGDDPRVIVNLTVWETTEALFDYVYKSGHAQIMGRRREWFERWDRPSMVLWWVRAGHRPGLEEAMSRLARLAAQGPRPEAFTFKQRYPAPEDVMASVGRDHAAH